MTYTLSQLSYRVAREIGIVNESTATGGSTTTVIDTVFLTQEDDYWNLGGIWILRDAAGGGAAPEGESGVVSEFTASNDTATIQTALTVAVASGDRYAISDKRVPLRIIEQAINEALLDLGKIVVYDTTLSTADNQTEYTLPTTIQDVRQVFIQSITTDENDNRYSEILNWSIIPSAAGVASFLVLPYQYPSGYNLMIYHMAYHAEMLVGTAKLSEFVPVERVVYPAILKCFEYRRNRTGWHDWDDKIAQWTQKVEAVRASHPLVMRARKPSKLMLVQDSDALEYKSEPNKVYL